MSPEEIVRNEIKWQALDWERVKLVSEIATWLMRPRENPDGGVVWPLNPEYVKEFVKDAIVIVQISEELCKEGPDRGS